MAPGARRSALAALAVVAAALGGCEGRAELASVKGVHARTTDLAPALADAGVDAAFTVEAAKEGLRTAGLEYDAGARRGYVATVEVIAFTVTRGVAGAPPQAEVVLDLELAPSWAAGPRVRRTGRAQAPLAGGRLPGAWREALRAASAEAAVAATLDLKALRKDPAALVAELDDGDPRRRERALRALTARGDRSAVRAIERRVRDRDPAVSRAAIDAVMAFRDPGSALALIEAAQAGDTAMTMRLLPVLVELGGPDVEGYLLTLQAGHADRAVRRAASEGLARFRGGPARVSGERR